MPWVKSTKTNQASVGAKMRAERWQHKLGRQKEFTVKGRRRVHHQGILIDFTDGSTITLGDAKAFNWTVKVEPAVKNAR